MIIVRTIDPMTTPLSPKRLRQSTVVKEAARMFTKLFPIRITPNNLSGLFNNLSALIAALLFSFTRCFSRYLFKDIIAVSTPEKKAERKSRKTMLENSIQGFTSANFVNYSQLIAFCSNYRMFYLNTKLNYLEYAS